ncbi:uncharacterized protein LOC121789587 isoform X2 [Salvia splendens]|uniref:uncharacterized protein LOC121789587 isoform X2 n=1 Tax=Salvia splendens TaxID=180675 RepID=UPI001C27E04F|nr:uncharacterized protein LOC121789587 isoform X2 [Salvia splendens]XP_042043969.1 uncharacterized protein LOC121789587 isoform X2 [Salvia splendens]
MAMRFKAGDTVEVMQSKELPASWRAAEILSCSGETYTIQYVCYPGMENKRLVEVVSRKLLRPCPSTLQGAKCFITGDMVEVFHQYTWKIAVVLNVLGGKKESRTNKIHHKVSTCKKKYLVRLLGCSKELAIDRTKVRMRQTWHDVKWLQLRKIPQAGDDVIVSKPSKSKSKYQPGDDCGNFQDEAAMRESAVISSRSLKRMSPYISSIVEAHEGPVQKFRAAEKEDRKQRIIDKVHAVACPKEILGETYMHASHNIISNGYAQMEREKQNAMLGYSGFRDSELNCSDSDVCSVGSCSITNQSLKSYYNYFMHVHSQETDTHSDAESFNGSGFERENFSLPPKEEFELFLK